MSGMSDTNHPADMLARVREQIRALQQQEDDLKAALKAMPEADLVGRWHEVRITEQPSSRLDVQRLRDEWGDEWLEGYKTTTTATVVTVKSLGN